MQPTAVLKRGPIRVGHYDLLEGIGNGRLGTLYRAHDRDTGTTVAVRILRPAVSADPGRLEQVFESFRTAAALDHPNLIRALDCGTDGSLAYLVTEFVDALSLGQVLTRSGKLPEATAVRIITHVAQGLDYAHRRDTVHGAVRPDAVLVRPDGFAKLAGFGEARDVVDPERAERGLCFTAPEQGAGVSVAGVRADVYSLAATLYAAVTGTAPFAWFRPAEIVERKARDAAPSPRSVAPAVSELLDRAVRRGMSPVPTRRPGSVLDFVKLLPPVVAPAKGRSGGRRSG